MNLADKPCYPEGAREIESYNMGLTFKERLIIALATAIDVRTVIDRGIVSNQIIKQADAIIKELEAK